MTSCPRCGKQFKGNSIGSHASVCGVTTEELFWQKVNKTDTCWLWTGVVNWNGYGLFGATRLLGRNEIAHRFAWIVTNGDPKGLHVLHKCDVRRCCNPAHLFLGTNDDNMADKIAKGRQRSASVLTPEQVREIRANPPKMQRGKRGGTEFQAYAKHYGITTTTLSHLLAGRTWKNLPTPAGDSER